MDQLITHENTVGYEFYYCLNPSTMLFQIWFVYFGTTTVLF